MNKIFLKLSSLLLFFTLVIIIVQFIINVRLNDKKQYETQNDWHMFKNIDSDVLFVGNSRTSTNINPFLIDSSFNIQTHIIGQEGQDFEFLYVKLKNYLKNNKPPKELYFQFDRSILKPVNNLFGFNHYSMYWFNDFMDLTMLSGREGYNNLFRYIPGISVAPGTLRKIILDLEVSEEKKYSNTKGYFPYNIKWRGEELNFNEYYKIDTSKMKILDSLYILTDKLKIEFYLFNPPQTYGSYKKIKNQRILHENIWRRNNKYDRNVVYVDFNGENYSNRALFFDHVHLNSSGSVTFTKDLINNVKLFYFFRPNISVK
jgi:hypothetical protein